MNELLIALAIVILYCMIGMFIAALIDDGNDGALIVGMLWPITIGGALLMLLFLAPYKLGEWVRKKFGDKFDGSSF